MAPVDLAADVSDGVTIVCEDRQSDAAVDTARWVALARAALIHEGAPLPLEMGLLFVPADEIAELKATHLGGDGPTDVLAFPIDEFPINDLGDDFPVIPAGGDGLGAPPTLVGDVVICPAVASKAVNTGADLDTELALLVVHGVLHLLGHDHAEADEKAVMQERERELLATYANTGRHDDW